MSLSGCVIICMDLGKSGLWDCTESGELRRATAPAPALVGVEPDIQRTGRRKKSHGGGMSPSQDFFPETLGLKLVLGNSLLLETKYT